MPIFSGNGIDPLINKLDTKRIDHAIEKRKYDSFKKEIYDHKAAMANAAKTGRPDSIHSRRSSASGFRRNYVKISQTDKEIIDKYANLKQLLEIKKMTKVFIDVKECKGTIPEAREGASLCTYKDNIFVYGGIGSKRFDYFNIYNMNSAKWDKVYPKNAVKTDLPAKRFGHTMCSYKNLLILFGGCGMFSEKTKMHENFKDIRIFDINTFEWEIPDYYALRSYKHFEPDKKMYHSAAV